MFKRSFRSNGKARAYIGLFRFTTSAPQIKVVFRNDDDSYITGGNLGIGTINDPGVPLDVLRNGSSGVIGVFSSDTAGNSGILLLIQKREVMVMGIGIKSGK